MSNLDSKLMDNVREVCKLYDGKPEAVFVKGSSGTGLNKKVVTIMLVGPRLNLESLAKLRKDMIDCLDAKEEQLRKDPDSNFAYKVV